MPGVGWPHLPLPVGGGGVPVHDLAPPMQAVAALHGRQVVVFTLLATPTQGVQQTNI